MKRSDFMRLVIGWQLITMTLLAGAAELTWDGGGGSDNRWVLGTNWSNNLVPTAADGVTIDQANAYVLIKRPNSAVAQECRVGFNTNQGPASLEISGGLNLGTSYKLTMGYYSGSNGTVRITGGTVDAYRIICGFSGNGTFIMDGGRVTLTSKLLVANGTNGVGHVQLNAGTLTASELDMRYGSGAVGTMEITGGKLLLSGDWTTRINTYVSNGWITTPYGKIIVDYNTLTAGKTTVFASSLGTDLVPPTQLYYIYYSDLTDDEEVCLNTLQGILARYSSENLYFYKADVSELWINDLSSRYGITLTDVRTIRGSLTSFQWALSHFAAYIDGYMLYDESGNDDSLSVACSLAGLFNHIAVDDDIKSVVDGMGIPFGLDVRTRDDQWTNTNYGNRFRQNGLIVKNCGGGSWMIPYFRDMGAAYLMMNIWNSSTAFTGPLYDSMAPNSPCFGWMDAAYPDDELGTIDYHSQKGLYQQPIDSAGNVSIFAAMANRTPAITMTQKEATSYTKVDNKHHVCIIYSDMDNLAQTMHQNWATGTDRYGSTRRGSFCMGWGMPPSMAQLAPTLVKWYYDNAVQNKDNFVFPFSGTGYFTPSDFDATEISAHVNQLGQLMTLCDLRCGIIYDAASRAGGKTGNYANITNARGFFVAGEPYNEYGSDITWTSGKPFIPVRDLLWTGFDSPSTLAAKINARSTNASTQDAYTVVMLHAWSYTTEDAYTLTTLLNSNVRVVTPEELVEQVIMHNVP